jgi:transcriptional regulator with XRE-family HTH domain
VNEPVLTLVPPRRLGELLAAARAERAASLDEIATATSLSPEDLARVEQGDRLLADGEAVEVLAAYGVAGGELVPERAELVVDLREQTLAAGGEVRTLAGEAPAADEVLASYLSLVYTLRRTAAGTPIVLRDADVAVLATVLRLARGDVEHRLQDLMDEEGDGEVARRMGLLRHRLLLPVAGVVVAVTAVGALLLVPRTTGEDGPAAPPSTISASTAPTAPDPAVDEEPAELGPAVVQTPDEQVVIGNDVPLEQIPDVGLAPAQGAIANPDGSVTQYTVAPDDTQGTGGS